MPRSHEWTGFRHPQVHAHLQATFGDHAYWEAAQRVRRRPNQPVTHTPHIGTDPSPLLCGRAFHIAANEAIARDQDVGPEHLLLGLLRDAEDPVETDLAPQDRRQRVVLGLPDRGPNPIRLLVEARGLTLGQLHAGVLEELDRGRH
jgi:Clp amino terminal domain, pathogenicity island component